MKFNLLTVVTHVFNIAMMLLIIVCAVKGNYWPLIIWALCCVSVVLATLGKIQRGEFVILK